MEHNLLHGGVEAELQGDHSVELGQVVGQGEGGGLGQACPANASVQVLQWGGRKEEGGRSLKQPAGSCCGP